MRQNSMSANKEVVMEQPEKFEETSIQEPEKLKEGSIQEEEVIVDFNLEEQKQVEVSTEEEPIEPEVTEQPAEQIEPQDDTEVKVDENEEINEELPQLSDDDIEIEIDSSSDSSSSSESDSDSEVSDNDDEYDSGNEDSKSAPIVSKNEVINEESPRLPDNYQLGDKPIESLGIISGFVDNSIIIKGLVSGEFRILKENSILCIKDKPLGPLFEIFGNLKTPIYRIKFNSDDQETFNNLKESIPIGEKVYYVVPDSQFIYTEQIKVKGSDASNFNDEEIPEEEQEYSDDEQEMLAKRRRKKGKKSNTTENKTVKKSKFNYQPRNEEPKPQIFQPYGSAYGQSQAPTQPPTHLPTQAPQPQAQQPQPYQQPYQAAYPQPYPQPYQNTYQQPYPTQPNQYQQGYEPQIYGQQTYNQYQPYPQQSYPQAYSQYGQPQQGQQPNQQQGPSSSDLQNALSNASPEQIQMIQQLLQNQNNNGQ